MFICMKINVRNIYISVLKDDEYHFIEPEMVFSMWVHCKGTYGGTSSNCQNHK